jgi:hypothetical protein
MEQGIATPPSTINRDLVFTDVLSYAITGELIGMANYADMVRLLDDPAEQMEAVHHAAPELAAVFKAVGDEEEGHVDHAVQELKTLLADDVDAFEDKVEQLNDEVMYHLAHMVAARDNTGPCGLCQGHCLKEAVSTVGLERTDLRGRALNRYLRTLDRIGVRGERSLAWVARLPM